MRISTGLLRRSNQIGIQLIPEHIRSALFGPIKVNKSTNGDDEKLENIKKHLSKFGLSEIEPEQLQDSYLNQLNSIPLEGSNINQHFFNIGSKYSDGYRKLLDRFLASDYRIPPIPRNWQFIPGTWIKYLPADEHGNESYQPVAHPPDDVMIFDVEITVKEEGLPAIATALSPEGWYSWASGRFEDKSNREFIPFGRSDNSERLLVGHNVSFDRSFLAEQYDINLDKTRFMDTLSMHVCVCGLTSHQRGVMSAHKTARTATSNKLLQSSGAWVERSSLNSLADCLKFHCGEVMDKEQRNIFVTGSLEDVRQDFAPLMSYCAKDVIATLKVLRSVGPQYFSRFPHPVTFAGMLEMSTMYLPTKMTDWKRYIDQAQDIYDDREREITQALKRLANTACASIDNYENDIFLWDLDWTIKLPRLKKPPPPRKRKINDENETEIDPNAEIPLTMDIDSDGRVTFTSPLVDEIKSKYINLYKKQPIMTGFPQWYRDLCEAPLLRDEDWDVGPYKISTGIRCVPKLMKLLWNGFPLHHDRAHGWGYLVPTSKEAAAESIEVLKDGSYYCFPLAALHRLCGHLVSATSSDLWNDVSSHFKPADNCDGAETITNGDNEAFVNYLSSLSNDLAEKIPIPHGQINDLIPGVIFRKLPHKNGFKFNVGNPLSKDFIHKVEDRTLTSEGDSAGWILDLSASLSYWRNAHKRIKDQLILPEPINQSFAAIIPRVVVAGTVTRRAVEKTWLTASNIVPNRLGCELKSMISAPEGYHFVGADVDSQELWIASLLGDSLSYKEHGCTALGWMTLRGNKTDGTDMHSRTADLVKISRKEAKILNYARIYGAGVEFVQRFLMQNDHSLEKREAFEKAKAIFDSTKGKRVVRDEQKVWSGGSESDMFNALEKISSMPSPQTPFLHSRMSQALEPKWDKTNMYTTSRLNWVVQSSAVDFLHLLIISMKYFMDEFKIAGRFSISIHDEVRFLIASDDRYRAALALHLSNLYVRAFFAHQLGLFDLPLSIAFFESVEIDRVIRKDVKDDCVTVSNPHGLSLAFGIPFGEAINMRDLLVKKKARLAI